MSSLIASRYPGAQLIEDLERYLGDPLDPATVFSFARCGDLDARERFPAEICEILDAWQLARSYVPVRHGEAMASFDQPLHVLRALARRDVTVAVAHGKTFLGAVSAWVAGRSEQQTNLGRRILDGAVVSWGLTERDHGGDLLAGDVSARRVPGGYRVTGEKWLINNATRGDLISLLVRTDPAGGPRGFDVLLVDKSVLAEDSFRTLPKVATHGIRGADISGIAFDDAFVSEDSLIGKPGTGSETVLKGLQLTRTLCTALSLGASDHALRLAVDFAENRRLYGQVLARLPQAHRVLTDAYADHLLAEAMSLVAARSVHALPGEMSVVSAAAKFLVPVRTDETIAALGRLLGARSFLADTFADGAYQKVVRDHGIVSLFDGSTVVNLNAIINAFPVLAKNYRVGRVPDEVRQVFDLTVPLPEFDPSRLSLVSRNGNSVLNAVADGAAALHRLAISEPALAGVAESASRLAAHANELHRRIARHRPARIDIPATAFELAARYALCYAGACAVGLWLGSHAHAEDGDTADLWRDGIWLRAVLARLLTALGDEVPADPPLESVLADSLRSQAGNGRLLSLLPISLAEGLEP
ncbi:acyl-CoA dehydrogenase family protein [Amycolatopsis sp. VS8301801F10]|uniref:acyl-CoA dehydrogenase family protein n=1 Tax=Amycolatopsis sp. VS8301801F10 TaxID=2652442 RepID=UPI0038FCC4DE